MAKKKKTLIKFVMPNMPTEDKSLKKAAKQVAEEIHKHFTKEKKPWPLDYSILVQDVFYKAFNHNLENYLINAIKEQGKYCLVSGSGRLLIDREK